MIAKIGLATGLIIILIGLFGILTNRDLFKMVIGFSIFDTGIHIVIVAIGSMKGETAPILTENVTKNIDKIVDPLPQAMVLTAIVIGLGITALMLVFGLKARKNISKNSEFEDLI